MDFILNICVNIRKRYDLLKSHSEQINRIVKSITIEHGQPAIDWFRLQKLGNKIGAILVSFAEERIKSKERPHLRAKNEYKMRDRI